MSFELYAEHVAPVFDLRLTNRPLCFLLMSGQNQFLSQATRFASDLLQCLIFQSLTRTAHRFSLRVSTSSLPKHLGCVEQYQCHLRARLSNTDTTLRARLSKSRLIPPTIHLPFLRGDFRLPPRVLGSGTRPCAINDDDDDDDDDDDGRMDHQLDKLTRKVVQQNVPFCV